MYLKIYASYAIFGFVSIPFFACSLNFFAQHRYGEFGTYALREKFMWFWMQLFSTNVIYL
jgi:hypothetical protein